MVASRPGWSTHELERLFVRSGIVGTNEQTILLIVHSIHTIDASNSSVAARLPVRVGFLLEENFELPTVFRSL